MSSSSVEDSASCGRGTLRDPWDWAVRGYGGVTSASSEAVEPEDSESGDFDERVPVLISVQKYVCAGIDLTTHDDVRRVTSV